MSATVNYKNNTIATIANGGTKTLLTSGTWLEDDIEIVDTTSEGGSGTDVKFIDYDGTVLHTYTAEEAQALTALPANPTHSGLTSQGWNYTLSEMKAQVTASGGCIIGQMYVTDDGKTRLYCHFEKGRLSPYLQLSPNGTVIVDWGDNSATDTLEGTSTAVASIKSVQHNYSTPGDYVITLTVTGTAAIWGSRTAGTGSFLLQKSIGRSETYAGLAYRNAIRKIELGTGLEILTGAFCNMYSLESISIPSYITSVGAYAFQNCYSIVSITIPNAVTSIKTYAFQNCYSLTSITIPDGVTRIEPNVFQYCCSLASITIPDRVTSIETSAFSNCNSLTSITIPDGVTNIGTYAFSSCYSLANITIPDEVTRIEKYTFQSCCSLASITMPDGITNIGTYAFSSCYSLANITIPDRVTSIGTYAFSSCYGMAEYHFLSTTPPTLANTNVFGSSIQSDCKIYVPAESLEAYKTATNWSTYASYMVGE